MFTFHKMHYGIKIGGTCAYSSPPAGKGGGPLPSVLPRIDALANRRRYGVVLSTSMAKVILLKKARDGRLGLNIHRGQDMIGRKYWTVLNR